jgi:translation initiation factor 5B
MKSKRVSVLHVTIDLLALTLSLYRTLLHDSNLNINPILSQTLFLTPGKVTSIENNHREVESAKKGTSVSIKIACDNSTMTYGRQFDHTNALYSKLTRASIDALKQFFKE